MLTEPNVFTAVFKRIDPVKGFRSFLAAVFGLTFWEFPFLPRQLSAVDGFTIGIPAFLIALLPNKARYQPGFLKRSLLFCVPAGTVTALAVIGLAWFIRLDGSWAQSEAQSATAMLLSITGLWVLATLERPIAAVKLGILAIMTASAVAMFTLPVTSDFFGLTYLTPPQLLLTFGVALVACLGIELVNFVTGRKG